MPARKPIVLVNGAFRQLPPGDTLDAAASEVDVMALTNEGTENAPVGAPVYISSNNAFGLARANAGATVNAIALVRDPDIPPATNGIVQTDGALTTTTARWDAITGESGGLIAGAIYFLSAAAPGQLTRTAPTGPGEFVLKIGTAISSETLEITITVPVQL